MPEIGDFLMLENGLRKRVQVLHIFKNGFLSCVHVQHLLTEYVHHIEFFEDSGRTQVSKDKFLQSSEIDVEVAGKRLHERRCVGNAVLNCVGDLQNPLVGEQLLRNQSGL